MALPSKEPQDAALLELKNALNGAIKTFSTHIESVMKNHHLADRPDGLEKIADAVIELNKPSKKASGLKEGDALMESLKDTGDIVQNILTQPLSIPAAKADISLIEAALSFEKDQAGTSDLRKILLSLLQFPEPTEMMLRELEILGDELG